MRSGGGGSGPHAIVIKKVRNRIDIFARDLAFGLVKLMSEFLRFVREAIIKKL